jgi:thiamine biosynthesis lipoprotein
MGVPFRIVLYAPDADSASASAEAVYQRVAQLNAILSDYDPDSEANRACHDTPVGQPVHVSPELWTMLDRSVAVSRATEGAFDCTIGPLVNLWRRARRHGALPAETLITEAKARVGWERLRLDRRRRTVTFLAEGMRLDFGGIAKGYAADEAARVLRERGVNRFLVAAAGDIVAGDPPPGQPGWRVEVGGSDATNAPPPRIAWLRRAAVSTSGDLFQRLEIGGRRYSHILDPRTGIGLTDRSFVTVIARDATTTDSLSTAVSVLGPERGLRLIERTPGASVLVLRVPEGRSDVEVLESRSFPAP